MFGMYPPYNRSAAVTKSDTVNITHPGTCVATDALYIGGAGATGTMVVVQPDDTTATFVGLVAGSVIPIAVKRINNSTTTVTNVMALYRV